MIKSNAFKIILLFIFLIGIFNKGHTQNYNWVKQIGGKESDREALCKILPNGNTLVSWRFIESSKIDTFDIKSTKSSNPSIISCLNKDGKVKWIWKPDNCNSYIFFSSICYSQSLSKIFVCGNFGKDITVNKVNYKRNNIGFVMRLDTNGVFEKIYTLADSARIDFDAMQINDKNEIFLGIYYDKNSNVYYPNFKIPSLNFSINKRACFVIKLDEDLIIKEVSKPLYGRKISKFILNATSKNKLFGSATFIDTLSIDSINYFNGKDVNSTYLLYFDSSLRISKNNLLFTNKPYYPNSSSYAIINSIKLLNDGSIVIGGQFLDSISLIPDKYKYKSNNYMNNNIPLFACLDSNLKLKWIKRPKIPNGKFISAIIYDLEISGNYILAGGYFYGSALFDNFNLSDSLGVFWFFKTDLEGNILWMNRVTNSESQALTSISVNKNKEALLSGYFYGNAKLNGQNFNATNFDILLFKITDNEIIRGKVNAGPYCAGDTIIIPFNLNGEYKIQNQFIAQLSDENGNFNGKERELGRLNTSIDGTIKGILPLFDVISSKGYRIRIISTDPPIESNYRFDTLQLLIHSKDKANAGNDTSICLGQKVILKTTGGSQWKWSPGQYLVYSTSKTTIAIPSKTVRFMVIISDSNVCIKSDTSYKTVTVLTNAVSNFDWDLTCNRTNTNFQFIGKRAQLPTITSFYWNFSGIDTSTFENPSKLFTITGIKKIMLRVICNNGCSDTITKFLNIKKQTKANYRANDVCETDSVIFINQSQDAEAYNWKFGDGEYSSKQSPKHLYRINGVSQTFNVTLVSLLSGGCSDSTGNVVTINANPISDFSYSLSGLKIDLQATQANNTKYRWKFGKSDSAVTSNTNYTHTYTAFPNPNTVCLEVTNAAVCYTETCKQIVTTSISNTKPNGFKIYPNPNSGNFTIEIDNAEKDVLIEVYNSVGEMVERIESVGKISNINLNVAAGIYLVKVNNGEVVYNQKVSIVK